MARFLIVSLPITVRVLPAPRAEASREDWLAGSALWQVRPASISLDTRRPDDPLPSLAEPALAARAYPGHRLQPRHVILDWHAGLFGPMAPVIRPVQALVLVVGASLYAAWASVLTLAGQGSRVGLVATLVASAVGGLGNGLVIVYCPPTCDAAAPFGDLTHVGSLVFGAWAMYESWRALTWRPTR